MSHPNKFDGMMHEYCVKLGWCGGVTNGKPTHATDFIPETGKVSADDFAMWLILADGIDPDETKNSEIRKWKSQLIKVFVRHMGSD